MILSPGAAVQERLWGTDPQGWADFAEPHNRPLFDAVLDAAGVGSDTSLLDVGCGAGLALVLAERRGATVTGIDVTSGLLDVARSRVRSDALVHGEMEVLPFPDAVFDAVIGINSFQFASNPSVAFAEARRVCRPGGRVVASLFAEPERSESTAVHLAMTALSPPERHGDHAPYSLSETGALASTMAGAGLIPEAAGEVVCAWDYDDLDGAARGLLSSAGAARAADHCGIAQVGRVVREALAPFVNSDTGRVTMRNTFRWSAAIRPQ